MPRAHSLIAALTGAAALAAALAGCPAPAGPGGGKAASAPSGQAPTTGAPAKGSPGATASPAALATAAGPAAALSRSLSEGLTDERDLADYGYIFDDGSGIVAAGGGNMVAAGGGNMVAAGGGNMVAAGAGNVIVNNGGAFMGQPFGIGSGVFTFGLLATDLSEVDAPTLTPALAALADAGLRTKLRDQRQKLAAKAATRLAARADRKPFVDAVQQAAITEDPARGTRTYQFTAGLPWRGFTRRVLFIYTVNAATNMLVHGYSAVLRPKPNRPKKPLHQVRREYTLLADGGFKVTYFQVEPLKPRLLRRVVSWEKTVSAEGQVTGSGQISWYPLGEPQAQAVRVVPISVAGREEAETFKAIEDGAEAALEVTIDGGLKATARASAQAQAEPVDLEAVPAEAAPEDPAQPTTL